MNAGSFCLPCLCGKCQALAVEASVGRGETAQLDWLLLSRVVARLVLVSFRSQ